MSDVLVDLAAADGFLFDVDGCLVLSDSPGGVHGGRVLPGAAEIVQRLKGAGKRVVCCTNGSSRTPAGYASALRESGIEIDDDEMLTPPAAGARTIAHAHPGARVLVLGGAGMKATLAERGIDVLADDDPAAPDVVFVGWAPRYTQDEIGRACRAAANGAPFLLTAASRWFASSHGLSPGIAAAVASGIEYVAGRPAEVVGKPSAAIMDATSELLGVPPPRMVIVGDDPVAEVGMGREHGALTVLVLSGITDAGGAAGLPPERTAHVTVPDVSHLLAALEEHLPHG